MSCDRQQKPSELHNEFDLPKMASKIPLKNLARLFSLARNPTSRSLSTTTETQTKKLERIADELLSLSNLERHDYSILFRHKMGLNKYGPSVSGPSSPGAKPSVDPAAAVEKTAFDVKLEKFDVGAKIKIIKEVRSFTDLGLKEAKDLVEKAPVVVKKGVAKEEADSIAEKLKGLGATVVLE